MNQSFCPRCQATVFAVESGGVSVCPQCNAAIGADDRRSQVTPAFAPKSSSAAAAEDEPKKPSRLKSWLTVRTILTLVLAVVVLGFAAVILTRESPTSAFERIQANAAAGRWAGVWDRIDNRSQTRLHESMRVLLDRTVEAAAAFEEPDLEKYRPMKEYTPKRLFVTLLEKHEHTRKLLARRYVVDTESEGDNVRLHLAETADGPPTESVLMVKEAGVWKLSLDKETAERFAVGPALPPPPPVPPPEPPKRAEGLNQWMAVGNVEVCVTQVGVGKLKLHPIDNTVTSGKDDVLLVEVKVRLADKGKTQPYKSWQQRYDPVAVVRDPEGTAYKRPPLGGMVVVGWSESAPITADEPVTDVLAFAPPPGADVEYLDLDLPAGNVFPTAQQAEHTDDAFRFRILRPTWTAGAFFRWRPKRFPVVEPIGPPHEYIDPFAGGYARNRDGDPEAVNRRATAGPAEPAKLAPDRILFVSSAGGPVPVAIDGQTLQTYLNAIGRNDQKEIKAQLEKKNVVLLESFSGFRVSRGDTSSYIQIVSGPKAGERFAIEESRLKPSPPECGGKPVGKSPPAGPDEKPVIRRSPSGEIVTEN
jgi:hypothetical protein